MGSGGKKKEPEQPKVDYTPITQQMQAQQEQFQSFYEQQLNELRSQSQLTLDQINNQNSQAIKAIQDQLAASEKDKAIYQQTLADYLQQLRKTQADASNAQNTYNQQLKSRDEAAAAQRLQQQRDSEASNAMAGLLAASNIARKSFAQKTRRRGVIV